MKGGFAEHFKAHPVIKASDGRVSYDQGIHCDLMCMFLRIPRVGCVLSQDCDLLIVSLECHRHTISSPLYWPRR